MLILDAWSARSDTLLPTLGEYVCTWIEAYCVHGHGVMLGQPVTLTDLERGFIHRLYELHDDGARRARRALLGLSKGSRKTDLASWLGLAELAGPVRFERWINPDAAHADRVPLPRSEADPEVLLFANSKAQARRMQDRAGNVVTKSPHLRGLLKVERQGITFRDPRRSGILTAIAAEAGTADGYAYSAAFGDELHDMIGRRKKFHRKIVQGVVKRPDAICAGITTAGDPHEDSVARDEWKTLQRLRAAAPDEVGRWVAMWRTCDPALLATAERDVDPVQEPDRYAEVKAARRLAVEQANPEPWKDIEGIIAQLADDPSWGNWARYYLNAWVTQDEAAFARAGAWDSRSAHHPDHADRIAQLVEFGELVIDQHGRPQPAPGCRVWLGFDGSRNRDATALVGVTASRFAFVVRVWEAGPEPDWTIPEHEVDATVRSTFERYDVAELVADPWGTWGSKWMPEWANDLGAARILSNPMGRERTGPQVVGLWRAIHAEGTDLLHDGSEVLHRHVHNALMTETRYGAILEKRGGKDSTNWIDAAVALTYADDARTSALATRLVSGPQIFFPDDDEEAS